MYKLSDFTKFKLTIFKTYKIHAINYVFTNLNKLLHNYNYKDIYNNKDRNAFGCDRSLIVSPFGYLFKDDNLFQKRLEVYKVHYIEKETYDSAKQCFVKYINGPTQYCLYKELPDWELNSKQDLYGQLKIKKQTIKVPKRIYDA